MENERKIHEIKEMEREDYKNVLIAKASKDEVETRGMMSLFRCLLTVPLKCIHRFWQGCVLIFDIVHGYLIRGGRILRRYFLLDISSTFRTATMNAYIFFSRISRNVVKDESNFLKEFEQQESGKQQIETIQSQEIKEQQERLKEQMKTIQIHLQEIDSVLIDIRNVLGKLQNSNKPSLLVQSPPAPPPPPPPLPPPPPPTFSLIPKNGLVINKSGKKKSHDDETKENRMPHITLEALKSVKLKQTPRQSALKGNTNSDILRNITLKQTPRSSKSDMKGFPEISVEMLRSVKLKSIRSRRTLNLTDETCGIVSSGRRKRSQSPPHSPLSMVSHSPRKLNKEMKARNNRSRDLLIELRSPK